MAATQSLSPLPTTTGAISAEKSLDARLAIHDTSRLEWAVSIGLPDTGRRDYAIELDLELPAHVVPALSPWNQLQELARLDGPTDALPSLTTIDGVRRFTVCIAAKLTRCHDGFSRHARLLTSPFETEDVDKHAAALDSWLESAEHMLADARKRLREQGSDDLNVARERALADEYLSYRLLEMYAGAEQTLSDIYNRADHEATLDAAARRLSEAMPMIETAGETLACALGREMDHRSESGYPEADADSPADLERYLDRASKLKKHFQEVLFLDAERFTVTERLHHWVAGCVAVVASTWAFVGQLYITRGSLSAKVSSSIVLGCVIVGLIYAVKDRIKEIGRTWFAANVHRFYAQRIARYRAPRKTCPARDVIVRARESFVTVKESRPDPLNPDSNAALSVVTLRYRHAGTVEASATLGEAGICGVKHVFRYDLSPLFARLDDATKPVPVFDAKARRIRFTQAPRCYRVPVRLVVRRGSVVEEQRGALIVHKRGLERIELY